MNPAILRKIGKGLLIFALGYFAGCAVTGIQVGMGIIR